MDFQVEYIGRVFNVEGKWKAAEPKAVRWHVAKSHRLNVSGGSENTGMLFTPAELYGAMAQCSSRAKMEQHAARA